MRHSSSGHFGIDGALFARGIACEATAFHTFSASTVAATVSPYAVQSLNGAFAEGKPVFSAGEPLGSFSFVAGVR